MYVECICIPGMLLWYPFLRAAYMSSMLLGIFCLLPPFFLLAHSQHVAFPHLHTKIVKQEDSRHSVISPKRCLGTSRPSLLTKVWLMLTSVLLIKGQATETLTHCICRSSPSGLLTSSFRQHQESLAAERERRRQEREERLQRIEREERNKFR